MDDVLRQIGRNIRQIRLARGLTMRQLADSVSDLCGEIGQGSIGSWQRGQRRISADHLLAVADVLGCSVVQLYGRRQELGVIHHLSQHERQIVRFAFDGWQGDVHPLIELMGLYMAFPRQIRAQISCAAIHVYRQAVKRCIRPNAPYDVRAGYILRRWGELVDKMQ